MSVITEWLHTVTIFERLKLQPHFIFILCLSTTLTFYWQCISATIYKLICTYLSVRISGFPWVLPRPGSHPPVPGHQQGAPVDTNEWGASDSCSASRPGLLPETPWLLPGRHGDTPPLPAPGRGVHRPQKPQVCHEAPVRDVCVGGGRWIME